MKKIKNHIWMYACIALTAALWAGCDADPIRVDEGTMPGEGDPVEWQTTGKLRAYYSPTDRCFVTVADQTREVPVTFTLERALPHDVTVEIEFVEEGAARSQYDDKYGYPFTVYPEEKVSLSSEFLTVKAGETRSNTVTLIFDKDGLTVSTMMTALTVKEADQSVDVTDNETVYVIASRLGSAVGEGAKGMRVVTYVDTEKVKPAIITDFHCEVTVFENMAPVDVFLADPLIDMVNLNVSQIRWDETYNRALLYLNEDITHILYNRDKYLGPLQDLDVDVCLVIRGGNTGIGFSNMTDAQIEDFAFQVASAVKKFGLDGVNLWDEDAGYGREGTQPVTLTSYPKFIRALREMMPDKLITLVDVGEPTSTFNEAHGGIRVGDLIDYAWHGYPSQTYVNPWEGEQGRSPILGITPDRYSMVFQKFEWLNQQLMEQKLEEVIMSGLNKVFVFDNIPTFKAGDEGLADGVLFLAAFFGSLEAMFFGEGYDYYLMSKGTWSEGGYSGNIWAKDW